MANIDDGFRVEKISLDDLILITAQSADPTIGAGYEAPIGSIYARTNGTVYRKIGTADVDWIAIDGLNSAEVFEAMKEPTGYRDRSESTISFDAGTRTFTIQPLAPATSFEYYIRGTQHVITTAKQIVLPDVTGLYYIYFNSSEVLIQQNVFTAELILSNAITAIVYWNATAGEAIYVADERHGLTMDGQTHLHFHVSLGTQFITGLALSDIVADGTGDDNANARCAVANGVIRDEDIDHAIYDTGGAVNDYDLEQELTPIAQVPVLYRLVDRWHIKAADDYPFIYDGTAGFTGTGRPAWNEFTGGAWQLTEVTNNRFILVHLLATNDINHPIVAIQGIAEYQTKPAGRDAAAFELNQLSGLPFAEFTPIATLILECSDSYSNTPSARIRTTDTGADYVDWRQVDVFSSISAGGGVTDHGNLGGLLDDDHTQYALAGSGSTRTFDIDDLNNVVIASPTNGQILIYNGSNWVNQPNAGGSTQNLWETFLADTGTTTADTATDTLTVSGGNAIATSITGDTLSIAVVEGDIDHQNLTGVGTNTHAQIDTHIGDATIHFTEASINHVNIQNVGTNTHAQIDLHIADATIHFTEASINHVNIQNVGTNTHAQIDTHIADATIHFTEASISHLNIQDIGTNTHAQIDSHIAATNNPHSTAVSNLTDVVLTALASGEILQYNGTNWVNVASSATDELVKVSATDTTSGYLASKLVAGTNITFTTLNSGANEQIQIDATAGAGGEANTASNIGTAGVGLFDAKVGVDLQFKNINAGSNKITVTDDVANNEVDIDVAEANIVHQNLSGAGTNTHAQIDSHIADATIHFTEGSISHLNIQDIGTNTHAQIDTHIADSTIHFTEASINHANIQGIGTFTHGQIDSHINSTLNPHNTSLAGLIDTTIVTPTNGQILQYTGTTWANTTLTGLADQNLWATILADTGTTTANIPLDTLTVTGGNALNTSITGDTLTIHVDDNPVLPGNAGTTLPTGTTAQRPITPTTGTTRMNTSTGLMEYWDGTRWMVFGSYAGSNVTEILSGVIPHLQGTTTIPYDNTPPLITEGTQFFSRTITTTTANARIVLWFSSIVAVSNSNRIATIALFRDSTLIGVTGITSASTNSPTTATFIVTDTVPTPGTYTYSGRIGLSASATWYIGGFTTNANYGGAANTNNQYVLMRLE